MLEWRGTMSLLNVRCSWEYRKSSSSMMGTPLPRTIISIKLSTVILKDLQTLKGAKGAPECPIHECCPAVVCIAPSYREVRNMKQLGH